MAQTIYESSSAALIPQPERAVATFASGLVRVDRKYICRTAVAATHRATLAIGESPPDADTAPAIDGLFIYPDPQELQRGDGFTEFQVSAYGRTATAPRDLLMTARRWNNRVGTSATDSISYSVWEPAGTALVTEDGSITYDSLGLDESNLMPFDVRLTSASDLWSEGTVITNGDPITGPYAGATLDFLAPPGAPARIYDTPPSVNAGIQAYSATFTRSGYADRHVAFYIYLPVVKIQSKTSYGKFHEVTFTTERRTAELATE